MIAEPARKRRPYRRAQILDAAVKLFSERGYAATSMEDIGAVLGMTGPSIYRHFSSKREILEAAIEQAGSEFWLAFDDALRRPGTPRARLRALARVFTHNLVDNPAITSLALRERLSLSDEARAGAESADRRLVRAWIEAMLAARPDMPSAEARIAVRGALGLVQAIAETRTDLGRARVASVAERAMLAALLA